MDSLNIDRYIIKERYSKINYNLIRNLYFAPSAKSSTYIYCSIEFAGEWNGVIRVDDVDCARCRYVADYL
ncbi:hypothetical protein DLM78_12100 [Leptospira stimsonii]|uniref:Uncharacterized protein n=1 Tax=Leptospira stimsonii TaxID=2202203 RepID=A0A8B6RYN9_9LEPT|nr:hypothetical protein DLM78_12100 [Leptospira stimsonii]